MKVPHQYANLFPMMTEAEVSALSADIAEHGLRHPIVLYQGQILDGRNRSLACKRAGVEPTFTEYQGDDPLGLVISLNIQRRDLTAAQRAIVAARVWIANGDAKPGRKSVKTLPITAESLSRQFRTTKPSLTQAKAILKDAPDLATQVEACALSLAAAYQQMQAQQEEQKRQKAEADRKARDAEKTAQYREAVSSGEMTLDEALEATREEEREVKEKAGRDAEARGIWFGRMDEILSSISSIVATRTDEHLVWYVEPGAPGSNEHKLSASRISDAITQLQRVRDITFGVATDTEED